MMHRKDAAFHILDSKISNNIKHNECSYELQNVFTILFKSYV